MRQRTRCRCTTPAAACSCSPATTARTHRRRSPRRTSNCWVRSAPSSASCWPSPRRSCGTQRHVPSTRPASCARPAVPTCSPSCRGRRTRRGWTSSMGMPRRFERCASHWGSGTPTQSTTRWSSHRPFRIPATSGSRSTWRSRWPRWDNGRWSSTPSSAPSSTPRRAGRPATRRSPTRTAHRACSTCCARPRRSTRRPSPGRWTACRCCRSVTRAAKRPRTWSRCTFTTCSPSWRVATTSWCSVPRRRRCPTTPGSWRSAASWFSSSQRAGCRRRR